MTLRNRCLTLSLPALLWLSQAHLALGQEVKDAAGFFGPAAVQKATDVLRQIEQGHRKTVVVETFASVPSNKADQVKDRAAASRFFAQWAQDRVRAAGLHGVYVLICKSPGRVEVSVTEDTERKLFPAADRQKLRDLVVAQFKEKKFDQGLLDAVDFIRLRMDNNEPPAERVPALNQVKDNGAFFSPEALAKAERTLQEINRETHKNIVVETFPSVPANQAERVAGMSKSERDRFFETWLGRRASRAGNYDLYLLVCKKPAHFQIGVRGEDERTVFKKSDRDRLTGLLNEKFAAKQFDDGLTAGLEQVRDTLRRNLGMAIPALTQVPAAPPKVEANRPGPVPTAQVTEQSKTGPGAVGAKSKLESVREKVTETAKQEIDRGPNWRWIVWIVVALLGLWVLVGVFRALFGSRRQPVYGPPPGTGGYAVPPGQAPQPGSGYPPAGHRPPSMPPGYGAPVPNQPQPMVGSGTYYAGPGDAGPGGAGGGGGGGFVSGLLGGMFGAAAGNWIYDSVARRSGPSGPSWLPSASGGQPHSSSAPYSSSTASPSSGIESSGGDFDSQTENVGTSGGDFDSPSENASTSGGDFGEEANADEGATGGDFGDQEETPAENGGGDFGADSAEPSDDSSSGGDFGTDADAGGDSGGGSGGDSGSDF